MEGNFSLGILFFGILLVKWYIGTWINRVQKQDSEITVYRIDIIGVNGIKSNQRARLKALGAVEKGSEAGK